MKFKLRNLTHNTNDDAVVTLAYSQDAAWALANQEALLRVEEEFRKEAADTETHLDEMRKAMKRHGDATKLLRELGRKLSRCQIDLVEAEEQPVSPAQIDRVNQLRSEIAALQNQRTPIYAAAAEHAERAAREHSNAVAHVEQTFDGVVMGLARQYRKELATLQEAAEGLAHVERVVVVGKIVALLESDPRGYALEQLLRRLVKERCGDAPSLPGVEPVGQLAAVA
jgi:hypothetical protein